MKKNDLGVPITKYHLKELGWKDLLRVFLPFIIIVLTPIGYGFWRTLYGYSNFGPAAAATWGRIWFLIGGVLVIFLLIYSLSRLIKAHTWVDVYRWGIQMQLPLGRKRLLSWDEITGLTSYSITKSFFGINTKTVHNLLIHSKKYRTIKCHPGIKDQSGLKRILKKQVYGRLKPKLNKEFTQGNIIPFGELSISKQVLYLPGQEIPWEFIKGITVQKGILMIKLTEEQSIEVPIRKIFNLEILIHLIKTEI